MQLKFSEAPLMRRFHSASFTLFDMTSRSELAERNAAIRAAVATGLEHGEVASRYGVSLATVYRALRSGDTPKERPVRSPKPPPAEWVRRFDDVSNRVAAGEAAKLERAALMVSAVEDLTIDQVAALANVSRSTVTNELRRHRRSAPD